MDIPAIMCTVCKSHGHRETNCPTLSDPLKNGFYGGGGYEED